MEDTEIMGALRLLNEEIYERTNIAESPQFELISNGGYSIVRFLGVYLWNSNEDGRRYLHECSQDEELEPLEVFLRREARMVLDKLHNIWAEPAEIPAGDLDTTSVAEMIEVLRNYSERGGCSADKTRGVFRRHWNEYEEVYNWKRPISKENFNLAMAKFQ